MRTLWKADPGWWLVIAVWALPALLLFTGTELADTSDGTLHLHRIQAMTTLMQSGELYPRWIPWFHFGYGYPIFNYYAPLATWLAGALGALGLHPVAAFQVVAAGAWLAGAAGMYALGQRLMPRPAALLAVMLWLYAPTRLHEYWIQGSLPHVVATAAAPWVILALLMTLARPSARGTGWLGLALGVLLLAHQPTVLLLAIFCGALTLALLAHQGHIDWRGLPGRLLTLGTGGLLGLGLAAVFLLPTFLELGQIVINTVASETTADFLRDHTLHLTELFRAPPPFDRSDLEATIPHTYGLIPGLLALLGAGGLAARRRGGLLLMLAGGVLLSIWLATAFSQALWLNIPLMDQLRFPWRVLRVGIVPLSLLGGAAVLLLPARWWWPACAALCAGVIVTALPLTYPTGRGIDFSTLTPADALRYEQISGVIGSASFNEFRPIWSAVAPMDMPANVDAYATRPLRLRVASHTLAALERRDDRCFSVTAAEAGDSEIVFRQFYFPGWRVTLEGRDLPVSADTPHGRLRVMLPAGAGGVLCAVYAGTPLQHVAALLTLISGGLLAGLLLWRRREQPAPDGAAVAQPTGRRVMIGLAGGLVVLAIVNAACIAPQTRWFRLASPPDAPTALANSYPVRFGDAYMLLGYTLLRPAVSAGGPDVLEVRLFWRAQRDLHNTHRPLVELVSAQDGRVVATDQTPLLGWRAVPHTPAAFVSQTHRLAVPADTPQGSAWLRVRLIENATGQPVLSERNDTAATLPEVIQVTPPDLGALLRLLPF